MIHPRLFDCPYTSSKICAEAWMKSDQSSRPCDHPSNVSKGEIYLSNGEETWPLGGPGDVARLIMELERMVPTVTNEFLDHLFQLPGIIDRE